MFQKIIHFVDEKHFGDQVIIYEGEIKESKVYFTVIKDREEVVYFFVDENLKKMYPVNSYILSVGVDIDIYNIPEYLDLIFDIDLSRYGYSKCSDFLVKLIQNNIQISGKL